VEHARQHPGAVVALFQDEVSMYRQPSQACLWSWAGRKQPHLAWSHRSNTLVRVTGVLDAISGTSLTLPAPKISVVCLLKFYQQVLDHYPDALLIYLIQDNWPNHKHEKVREFLAAHPRLQVVFLPTYSPWLNPLEKLWRWVRQTFCHAHPFSDDFREFKLQLKQCLADGAQKGTEMLGYCGLTNSKIYT
jgi:transposase